MLLLEIKQVAQNKTRRTLLIDLSKSKHLQAIGSPGSQASAFQHTNKLNTIVKVVNLHFGGMNDPIIRVVKLFLEHSDNPFFPKIYTAKIYRDELDKHLYMIITMERLRPISASNEHLFEASIQQLYRLRVLPSKYDFKHPLHSQHMNFVEETEDEIEAAYITMFEMFSDVRNRYWLAQNTPDNNLKEAIKLLNPIFKDNRSDLHEDNVMVRLTSVGPQLVLMDPVIG